MYVKLFARITESSLMEEEIAVRYTFVMLLALADPSGLVVGTDIAISRRLNMPTKLFAKCVKSLQEPDPSSNSKECDGRRIVPSDAERGYQIVNYGKYRDLQSEDERRAYMRDYMRNYREGKPTEHVPKEKPVNNVKPGKHLLTKLTQADAASEAASPSEANTEEKRGKAPRVFIRELETKSKAKQAMADELVNRFTYSDSFGIQWKEKTAKKQYDGLMAEIKQLRSDIANYPT